MTTATGSTFYAAWPAPNWYALEAYYGASLYAIRAYSDIDSIGRYWVTYNVNDHAEARYYDLPSVSITGSNFDDYLGGTSGNDFIAGGRGNDTLVGEDGNDTMNGGDGADSVLGGNGDDLLLGGTSFDTLSGGDGDDTLDGGGGNDRMYGGAGNDVYFVDHLGDRVIESFGEGVDTVQSSISYSLTPDVEVLYLVYGAGDISGIGNGLSNAIYGNENSNVILGGRGNDSLYGGNGNDVIYGEADHDLISGGEGIDILFGGAGQDVLSGGSGSDFFVFESPATNGHDHIVDFAHGIDHLTFFPPDYGFTIGHLLTASEFTVGTNAVGTSAQFIWDPASHFLYWDPDGAGGTDATELALIDNGAVVSASDFYFW